VVYDRIGPRALVATGAALLGASLVWMAIMLSKLEYAWLLPAYVVAGMSMPWTSRDSSSDGR
jgi:hypothetical protein